MEPWVPFASLGMGVVAFVVCALSWRLVGAKRVPKKLTEWYPELEAAWSHMVHKRRELVEAIAHAEQLREQLPEEYKSVMDHVIIMAQASELALFTQARSAGLVPSYWFSDPRTKTPDLALTPGETPTYPSEVGDPDPVITVDNVVELPRHEWIGEQLVVRQASGDDS
jgi:uncharacterized membrane-anchored protein YhcB (DUF1043 family)